MKLSNLSKLIAKYLFLGTVGGLCYCGIELLWRGHTDRSMGILAFFLFLIIGGLNEWFPRQYSIWKQMIVSGLIVTGAELITGMILNLQLGLHIWDYSDMPFQFLGQICLPYTILWILLSYFAIVLDDMIRWIFFGEEKPHYNYHWK